MKVKIVETTDGKFIGNEVETDLNTLSLPNGDIMQITGKLDLGNGEHRIWNSNYIIKIKEI
jgi:hypothetical protein